MNERHVLIVAVALSLIVAMGFEATGEDVIPPQRDPEALILTAALVGAGYEFRLDEDTPWDRFECEVTCTHADQKPDAVVVRHFVQRNRDRSAILTVVDGDCVYSLIRDRQFLFVSPSEEDDLVLCGGRVFQFLLPRPPSRDEAPTEKQFFLGYRFGCSEPPDFGVPTSQRRGSSTVSIDLSALCAPLPRFRQLYYDKKSETIRGMTGTARKTIAGLDLTKDESADAFPISRFQMHIDGGLGIDIRHVRVGKAAGSHLAVLTDDQISGAGFRIVTRDLGRAGLTDAFAKMLSPPTAAQRARGRKLYRLLVEKTPQSP